MQKSSDDKTELAVKIFMDAFNEYFKDIINTKKLESGDDYDKGAILFPSLSDSDIPDKTDREEEKC